MSLKFTVSVLTVLLHRDRRHIHRDRERGQATAEYALVLLGAAVVAIALVTWATRTGRIGQLLDAVFDQIEQRVA